MGDPWPWSWSLDPRWIGPPPRFVEPTQGAEPTTQLRPLAYSRVFRPVAAAALIVYGLTGGFLTGYLWTRLFLPGAFGRAGREDNATLRQLRMDKADQEGTGRDARQGEGEIQADLHRYPEQGFRSAIRKCEALLALRGQENNPSLWVYLVRCQFRADPRFGARKPPGIHPVSPRTSNVACSSGCWSRTTRSCRSASVKWSGIKLTSSSLSTSGFSSTHSRDWRGIWPVSKCPTVSSPQHRQPLDLRGLSTARSAALSPRSVASARRAHG